MKSNSFELGSKGTPQGAVLSPLLFNLALRGLPEALGAVPGVEHAIYADDITLWCREGNDAEIEERLQAAAKIVEDYAEECGLKCAPEKSELLVLRNPYERVSEQIEVWVSGKRVSKPTEIRILGQLIRQGRGNKSTIDKLDTMTTQARIPEPVRGLGKEEEWTWRRLQTGTLVTPAKLHQWYPDRYTTGACPFC
ncbi:hypothetical protein ISCGN_026162, partial [Ixodes scapularis]